ncbi:hypothetical protein ABB37_01411 [Leptomonas pyrrhocoris]|uniref:Uncharacterized protein n=1 Tax=Leptomonas pyrrhocoris TaxID=157538 RepID=A0A0N0DZ78_LEPPY|nr:hypothetical protein ABB37_01411 [Leptomonas pyrrhocoris]KPA84975.1 hypothetical protein ABB37_01411 [Leptomonas pyrrhocoris]|eukprot:XP_015663414.1 hypothetical protein ABB37_01411 [Leptomonas pyrrhocoris]
MLNRVINDIYHLRRVHSILPDAVLGDTLKNKLLRLSLQPSLQQLKHEQMERTHAGSSTSSTSSSPSPAAPTKSPVVRAGRSVMDNLGGNWSTTQSPYAIDPAALCNLLDSLAYFHLGTSAVASEAVQLVQWSAPTMPVPHLCTTLAACCALGAQQDVTATALPLLRTALQNYTGTVASNSFASGGVASTPAAALSDDAQPLLFSQGANVVMLIDALQRAGVRDKEVWHLLAEHCLRYLESFEGRQLCSVVTALCAEGVDDYPDFFVAAERHITSQPPNYLSPDLLQQVVQCYKELHQPVVSLLAVINATPQHAENLDRSISAAATVAALSGTQHHGVIGSVASCASFARRRTSSVSSLSSPTTSYERTSDAASAASVQHSVEVFESAAISALAAADAQGVLELLRKCEHRRIMTARVLDTILRRLVALYYPALSTGEHGCATSEASGQSTAESRRHMPLELHQLSQCVLTALEFNDATLFVPPAQPAKDSSKAPPTNATKDEYLITVLLNAIGGELDHWYHPRLLQTVPYAVRLLPPSRRPQAFFTALVAHLRRSNDLSSHEGPVQLRSVVEALLALRDYGGEATLVEYMPAMTVAVLNAPRTSQLELTAMMAQLPCAAKELVPSVYRQWGSQKRWLRTITTEEVESALQIMARSGQRDSPLLHAVVAFVQEQRGQLPPQRVVEYLHQLARLGVRDLELFTHTAEHLMRRAVESTPSALRDANERLRPGAQAGGEGASSAAAPTSPCLAAAARHQQWQITTVHDLALLLYTFTFVLRDSIRVTQQIIARLKMCSSAATPRDISLVLYSFVKLRVLRHDEVTGQLCERAAATLADFTASELASTWSSLRCLHHPHTKLYHRTLELLDGPLPNRGKFDSVEADDAVSAAAVPTWRFTNADCLSLGSALLLTDVAPLNVNHPLVLRRGASPGGGNSAEPPAVSTLPATPTFVKSALPINFERQYVEVCRRLLPSASGQRLYLILCSLSRCNTTPSFSLDAWETVLKLVDTQAESLTTGRLGDAVGVAQLEVLVALHELHRFVADVDALNAADAVRVESSNWPTPYCPPGLWAVLRPRWRELACSATVQARPTFLAVVNEVKGGGGAEPLAAEPKKRHATRKPLVRRSRKA